MLDCVSGSIAVESYQPRTPVYYVHLYVHTVHTYIQRQKPGQNFKTSAPKNPVSTEGISAKMF